MSDTEVARSFSRIVWVPFWGFVVCGLLLLAQRVKKALGKDEKFLVTTGKQGACAGINVTG